LSQHDCGLFRDRFRTFSTLRLHRPQGEEGVNVAGLVGACQIDAVRRWGEVGLGITLLSTSSIALEQNRFTLEAR
jgi:hypothetical protein